MAREITSKNMGGVSELTLIAPFKPGLVEIRDTRTYATRLRIVLRTLHAIRQKGYEQADSSRPVGPLEKLDFLHFVRFAFLESDTKLMLTVTFDGPWEPYIRSICDRAGPVLDTIFCNCVGYDGKASDKGYEKFSEWVREHQVESEFYFAGAPGTTTPDIRYLKAREADGRSVRPLHDPVSPPKDLSPKEVRVERGLRALVALYGLSGLYPENSTRPDEQRDHLFLLRAAQAILSDVEWQDLKGMPPFEDAIDWILRDNELDPIEPKLQQPRNSETIQGNILAPYEGVTHGALLLMRFTEDRDAAAEFLNRKLCLRGYRDEAIEGEVSRNIAFTFEGLRSIGLPEHETNKLPKEFRDGMSARAGWLGDLGPNHPDAWNLPEANWPTPEKGESRPRVRLSSVDFVIQLQTQAPGRKGDHLFDDNHPLYNEVCRLQEPDGVELLSVQPLRQILDKEKVREHFGFVDGISQPTHGKDRPERDRVGLGELLLGYEDDHGDDAEPPLGFLSNGTYLVTRKLRQDVAGFQRFLTKASGATGLPREEIAARMMGRTLDGAPLIGTDGPDDNDFDYRLDPDGEECPLDSHIRRANPRNGPPLEKRARNAETPLVPRIIRRGFSYGTPSLEDDPEGERGLMFLAYNASITDQFEVIQRWISGGNSTGILSDYDDPILGLPTPGEPRTLRFVGSDGAVEHVEAPKPFVTLEWGMYLFVPSTSAVKQELPAYLKREAEPDAAQIKWGRHVLELLAGLWQVEKLRDRMDPKRQPKAKAVVGLQWKKVLEDLSARATANAVWAAIRAQGGVLRTPYGVLVGSAEHVKGIFKDPKTFSVREYWNRMVPGLGEHYLGMDPDPTKIRLGGGKDPKDRERQLALDRNFRDAVGPTRYENEAKLPNAWIRGVSQEEGYDRGYAAARSVLAEITSSGTLDLRALVFEIVARMSKEWFGIPDGILMHMGGIPDPEHAHCPSDFGATARSIFSPNPTGFVTQEGNERGAALLDASRAFVGQALQANGVPEETLFAYLDEKIPEKGSFDPERVDLIARTLVGSVHGFVGPTGGSSLSVLHEWIKNEDLWRHQRTWLNQKCESGEEGAAFASKVLERALVRGMQIQPFPYILHRTPVRDTRIGEVDVEAGERVVVGIVSATQEQPGSVELLFGGLYQGDEKGPDTPVHACPGQHMAMGTMLGLLTALFEAGELKPLRPLWLGLRAL